jgi:hypothetical protein
MHNFRYRLLKKHTSHFSNYRGVDALNLSEKNIRVIVERAFDALLLLSVLMTDELLWFSAFVLHFS